MKQLLTLLLAMLLLIPFFSSPQTVLATDSPRTITIFIDDQEISLDPAPIVVKGRTLVPLRGLFEALGATVDWNEVTNQVAVKGPHTEILLEIGNQKVLLDGKLITLDVPSQLENDYTFVPLRFIAEALGHNVGYNAVTHTATIASEASITGDAFVTLPLLESEDNLLALLNYHNALNQYMGGFNDISITMDMAMESESAAPSDGATSGQKSDDYASTNVQTAGVDEGDVIKTNGDIIVAIHQNQIRVLSPDAMNPKLLSTITLPDKIGYPSELYLKDTLLVVIGSHYGDWFYPMQEDVTETEMILDDMRILPIYGTPTTFVRVYDLNTPSNPSLVHDFSFDGSLAASRLIDSALYLMTNQGIYTYDTIMTPSYRDQKTDTLTQLTYDDIYYFPTTITPNFINTIGLDLTSGAVDMNSYLGAAEITYATMDQLFLAFSNYYFTPMPGPSGFRPHYEISTELYQFKLEDATIQYQATGTVPGRALNQYALDAYDGHFRIATTTGNMWDEANPSKNHVFILDNALKQVGQLRDLAPDERIYSTRFAGDRIYMVTFREIDPFFVIDASDPTNPYVLGDLKIPGFSTYMHLLSDTHILGFGSDVVDQDGFITTGGLKISLFDVTDPTNPIETENQIIGKQGTYSEIQHNPKALMIDLNKGLMAFPISISGEVPYVHDYVGAYVYHIDTNSFTYKAQMTHHDASTVHNDYGYKYMDYEYNIQRVIYIGNHLYALSNGRLTVYDLNTFAQTGRLNFK